MNKLYDDAIEIVKNENTKTAIIRYELDNHEYRYTRDVMPTFEAVECYGITLEEVKLVARGRTLPEDK